MTSAMVQTLRERLQAAFEPQLLEIRDDSAAHAGHSGARSGGHYAVRIVARQFRGRRLLERHRLVYTAVAGLLDNGVHALSIDARSSEETT
jgi:BolA family transcriptional regulator, general stress-responsive regulator